MVLDGWIGRWMDGWMGGRASLRIAYSNQKVAFGKIGKSIQFELLASKRKRQCGILRNISRGRALQNS